jgi:hypothetical protein
LSPDGRVVAIHGRPAPGRHQHRLGADQPENAAAHVDHQHARQPVALAPRDHGDGAVFLQLFNLAGEHLFHQPVDDLDPVRSPLCTVRSAVWPAKAFWCSVPSSLRSKKQPTSFSSSWNALDRGAAQPPGHILVRQPFAAIDRCP